MKCSSLSRTVLELASQAEKERPGERGMPLRRIAPRGRIITELRIWQVSADPPLVRDARLGAMMTLSKPCIHPGRDVIEQILDRVDVLTAAGGPGRAGRETVIGALDHDEILFLAVRGIVSALVVANEAIRTAGAEQHGNRTRLHSPDS